MMKPLTGKIAVVAGATRGAGRGIACMLGEAGATVYCTGRSTRDNLVSASRPETIEDTAEMVTQDGGVGIPVRVDHLDKTQVEAMFKRVRDQHKHLDILVNDIWGGEKLLEFGTPVWEMDVEKGLQMLRTAINSHIITSRYGLPLMVERKQGLVIEVTDGDTLDYRGNFICDIAKTTVIRMAYGLSQELKSNGITALALTPGFLRSEEMLDHFGVTEANWRDATKKDPHFIASETPLFCRACSSGLSLGPLLCQAHCSRRFRNCPKIAAEVQDKGVSLHDDAKSWVCQGIREATLSCPRLKSLFGARYISTKSSGFA